MIGMMLAAAVVVVGILGSQTLEEPSPSAVYIPHRADCEMFLLSHHVSSVGPGATWQLRQSPSEFDFWRAPIAEET